jgi:predicted metal-binding membrane protein
MMNIQLSKHEKIIIAALIAVSVIAWVVTIQHSTGMSSHSSMEMEMPMNMEHTSSILEASLFLVMWTVMMIAMMFPAVVPMVVIFSTVQNKRKAGNKGFIPTWVFVAGYLVVWASFGVLAYLADLLIRHLGMSFPGLQSYTPLISGVVLVAAGIYQLTPLKNVCLTHCRSPLHFITHKWREGYLGSLIMGVDHGAYCLGCCWGLMVVLFVMGLMNLAWMGILALVIFVEKISKHGVLISRLVGGVLIILGIVIAFQPEIFSMLI